MYYGLCRLLESFYFILGVSDLSEDVEGVESKLFELVSRLF